MVDKIVLLCHNNGKRAMFRKENRMDHTLELKNSLTKMKAEFNFVHQVTKRAIGETLMMSKEGSGFNYYSVTRRNGQRVRHLLNGKEDEIYRLAHIEYLRILEQRLAKNIRVLEKALDQIEPTATESIFPDLPKHFDKLDPLLIMDPDADKSLLRYPKPSQEVYPREAQLDIGYMDPEEWACLPYCENTDHLENKMHMTRHGVCCRSKSEAILFEIYDALGIMFHYDEVITIGGQRLSPDLIGVRRDGTLVFHEHRGLHSKEYVAHYDWKSGLYTAAGIYPGINLLYTYDRPDGSINIKLVEAQVRDIYGL